MTPALSDTVADDLMPTMLLPLGQSSRSTWRYPERNDEGYWLSGGEWSQVLSPTFANIKAIVATAVASTGYGATRLCSQPHAGITVTGPYSTINELFDATIPCVIAHQAELLAEGQESSKPHLQAIDWIASRTGLPQAKVARLIGVGRQALWNWRHGQPISDEKRERLFSVLHVLQCAAERYRTKDELGAWLYTPRGSDARTPIDLLEAGEIDRVRYLAISSASAGLKAAPAWVHRPIPEAFRTGEEHLPEADAIPRVSEADVSDAGSHEEDDQGDEWEIVPVDE